MEPLKTKSSVSLHDGTRTPAANSADYDSHVHKSGKLFSPVSQRKLALLKLLSHRLLLVGVSHGHILPVKREIE